VLAKVLMQRGTRPPGTHARMPRVSGRECFPLVTLERARGGLPRDRIPRHWLRSGVGVDDVIFISVETGLQKEGSGQNALHRVCFCKHIVLDSLGSRRGVDVDSGHRMRWLLHRSEVPYCCAHCPFVELG